jgi:hypothetical protein
MGCNQLTAEAGFVEWAGNNPFGLLLEAVMYGKAL